MKGNHIIIIGHVWPEPNSTAAGTRMLQLIQFFIHAEYIITFVSSSAKTENSTDLEKLGISCLEIRLNTSDFDVLLKKIDPVIVLFDRFYTEEKFGWIVTEISPKAIKILDTEDLHLLRIARHKALKNKDLLKRNYLFNETAKREIASIYRCDLSLIISTFELNLLQDTFGLDTSLLLYLPFLLENIKVSKLETYPQFKDRIHFISIGNFRHEPNWDAVQLLKESIWPLIRRKLPGAELHIFGAYATEKVMQLHNQKEGFIIKGRALSVEDAFCHAKVSLAPLQFGAGLKGKLIDAMKFGTPSVTTSIGAEAMHNDLPWNGFIEDNIEDFAKKAIELYRNEEIWTKVQQNGFDIINTCFSKVLFYNTFRLKLKVISEDLEMHRLENFTGAMLQYHTLRSTKYLSKWIEVKNKRI